MRSHKLLNIYSNLLPGLEKVYVFPHIERSSRFNKYMSLLYRDLLKGEESSSVIINSASFFSPSIIVRRWLTEKSVVHHHWFECRDIISLLNAAWKLMWLFIYRLSGGKIIWTVHNKYPHNRKLMRTNSVLRFLMARLAHRLLVHCAEATRIMTSILRVPPEKFSVVEHPDYQVIRVPRETALRYLRKHYSPGDILDRRPFFLMFGYVARYKGNTEVMESFSAVNTEGALILAGAVKTDEGNYQQDIDRIASECDRIFLTGRMIPDEDIPFFFCAADYLIFNFCDDILYSGGVHMALNYGKKIIIPDVGCFKELEGENIFKFRDREQLRSILRRVSSSTINYPD